MKTLLIIGARGWGREVYNAIKETPDVLNGMMKIKGFLDSNINVFDGLRGTYPPIICAPEDYDVQNDDIFFVAMGDPQLRRHYAEIIKAKGGSFYTFISEHSFVNETAVIGAGSYVSRFCIISDNVIIGEHVVIHPYSNLGHDSIVENYGTLLSKTFLGGGSVVGECSQLSPYSMIVPHKKIGKNVMVGSGSVVMRNVNDNTHVFGNPAKKIVF